MDDSMLKVIQDMELSVAMLRAVKTVDALAKIVARQKLTTQAATEAMLDKFAKDDPTDYAATLLAHAACLIECINTVAGQRSVTYDNPNEINPVNTIPV